ncbi:MAG: 3-deoxy-D-manno-octulosonic acid transferase [Terriglobales bacterium]|jgi:3-deoxy-D-manno-octulosonic-acid transferase
MYFLYSAALAVAFVLATPYWIFKMLRHGKYRAGLAERLGRVPERVRSAQPGDQCVWIHAVSVGEVLAISQLVQELKQSSAKKLRIVISTTTTTGQNLARERFGEENVFYFPLDFGFCIGPYMRALRPKLVVMAETEFWPNFLRKAKRCGAAVAVVNARISDRSLPGYRRWRGILARVLQNVDLFLAQSEDDKRRVMEIGAAPERVEVSGNLKFDVKPPAKLEIVEQVRQAIERGGGGPIIVAGSTVEGEEVLLLGAFQVILREHSEAVLILAPRHPERFEKVWEMLQGFGVGRDELISLPGLTRFEKLRRTELAPNANIYGAVLLLDTIGELASMYELGDVAIVGGSFVPLGGHNILEPAQFGKAIVVGPFTHNFRDIIGIFLREQAIVVARAAAEHGIKADLGPKLLELVPDESSRRKLGERALAVLESQRGATARTARSLIRLLEAAK